MVKGQTQSCGIMRSDLPYSYGFEDASTSGSSGTINRCYKKGTTSNNGYPYPSNNYRASGSYSMYFYGSSSYYSYLALPAMENGLNDLMVSFDLMKTSSSYIGFEVGVMTDSSDYSTFVRIASFTPTSTFTFENFTAAFTNYSGQGAYIAFRVPIGTQANYFYLDNIVVSEQPSCSPIRDVEVEAVTGTAAMIRWGRIGGLALPSYYELEIGASGSTAATMEYDTVNRHIFGNLTPFTTYTAKVRGVCYDGSYTDWDSVSFTTGCLLGGDSDPTGTESQQVSGCPVYSGYGNSFCQSIYTAAELRNLGISAGDITGCTFTWTINSNYAKRFHIYLDTTWRSTYPSSSSTYYHRIDLAHRYYSGTHQLNTSGTTTYTFDRPFHWDGQSNIVVTTIMNQPTGSSHSSSGFYGLSSQGGSGSTIYTRQDNTAYDTTAVPSGVYGLSANRPNIVFKMDCDSNAACVAPMAYLVSCSPNQATVAWAPGYQETSWNVEYRLGTTGVWIQEDPYCSTTDHTFYWLSPNTRYQVRITPDCATAPGQFSTVLEFTTPCMGYPLPFIEHFDSWSSTTSIPGCWHRLNSYTSTTYPYLSTSYRRSGGYSAYMDHYGSSTHYSGYVLPLLNTPQVDALMVNFWLYKTNTSYANSIQVGVMTNPEDYSTFVPVSTVSPTTSGVWQEFSVSLAGYSGDGRYIALVTPLGSSYNYVYLDDIYVDYTPNCNRPDSLAVSNITTSTADVTWLNDPSVTEWVLEYGPQGFALGTGTMVSASTNSTTLTGLGASRTYDLYLAAVCNYTDTSWYISTSFQTLCGMISRNDLPYQYGFEDASASGSAGTVNRCLYKGTNYSTAYPYPSNSYHASGAYSLYFYGTSSYYSYLALPSIENGVRDLMVSFDLLSTSASYGGFEVGVMTDSSNYSTFVQLGSFTPSRTGVFENFALTLAGYTGQGGSIAFRIPVSSQSNYFYLDNIVVSEPPACSPIRNLRAETITGTSAMITWGRIGGVPLALYYELELEEIGSSGTLTDMDTAMRHLISGLTPFTTYEVRVRGVCSDGSYTDWESLRFTTGCMTGGDSDPSGTGTNQGSVPVYYSSGNTFCQTIYTASQLRNMGLREGYINGCTYTWTTSSSYVKRLHIYLDTTWRSNFPSASTSYWHNIDTSHRNYCGQHLLNTTGTVNYDFYRPFYWDGRSNIVVTTIMNQNRGSSQSYTYFYGYSTTLSDYVSMYYYRSSTAFDTNSVPTSVNSRSQYQANMRFKMQCDTNATCVAPYAYVANCDATQATVAWAPGYQESSWNLEYRQGSTGTWTLIDPFWSATDYTFYSLTPNTRYQVRITPDCSLSPDSISTVLDFMTPCAASPLPFIENFDGWGSTYALPACWSRLNNYTGSTYPYLNTSYRHSGTHAAYMYHYSGPSYYSGYVLPPLAAPQVDALMVNFWLYKENTSYTNGVQVGVMTDPEDYSSFVPVATVSPTTSGVWQEFSVSLASYSGSGRYIALMTPPNNYYNYVYLDDIYVDYIPACGRPDSLVVTNISGGNADVAWNYDAAATEWVLEYGPQGFALGTGTMVNSYNNNITISGLGSSMTYDLYLAAICNYTDTSWYISTSFQTPCGDISRNDMPWRYGFEDASGTGSSATMHRCTSKGTNYSTSYPYPSSSYTASGNYSLYFYSYSSYYSYFVLPPVENTVTDLMVEFSTYMTSTYSGFEVGVMGDPTDYSTFTTIASAEPSASGRWQQFTVSLAGYTDTGRYIAFRAPAPGSSSSKYFYLDDISISVLPTCSPVRNLRAAEIHGSSVRLAWSTLTGFLAPVQYEIEVEETGVGSPVTSTDTVNWHVVGGLQPMTNYTARVRGVCRDGSYTDWISTEFTTRCLVGGDSDPSGTGTSQYSGCPVYSGYGNTFCQTFYTAAQLRSMGLSAGDISGCTYTWTTNSSYAKRFHIFIDTTSRSYFASNSTSYWRPISTAKRYYCGTHPLNTSGTVSYNFSRPFHWDGVSNIVVTTIMNQPPGSSHSSSNFYGISSTTSNYTSMYTYRDGTAYDTNSVPTTTGSRIQYSPNITFVLPCDANATCVAPYAYTGNQNDRSVSVHWTPGYNETSWDIAYRQVGSSTWTPAASAHTSTSYTFTGLQPNTRYQARITPDCSPTPDSICTILDFRTSCTPAPLPFSENFDNWPTSSTATVPSCWYKLYNSTTAYPYGSSSYNHTPTSTSGRSLYMYNNASNGQTVIVLPVLDSPTDSLELTFWAYKPDASYDHKLRVGVIEDPEDFSTFTQISPDLQCSQVAMWESFLVGFQSYSGLGRNIAIVSPTYYGAPYIDDINVIRIANCDRPTNCQTTSTNINDATVAWDGHGVGNYVIEYGPSGFQQGQGTVVTSTVDSITIFGLTANTLYDFYVRAVCNGRDSSNWSNAETFRTDCDDITTLPYTYGFEDATSSGSNGRINSCWTKGTNYTSTPYPYPYSSYTHSGSYSIYAYVTSTYYCYLALPTFQANINDLKISFWYKRTSTSYPGTVEVGVMTDPDDINTFTRVQTCTAANGTNWDVAEVVLTRYNGAGRYIALKIPASSTSGYLCIDDITVDLAGQCPPPTLLTSPTTGSTTTTAQVGWQENGFATTWIIEYGPVGFTLGQGTTLTTINNPTTLTGLNPSTDYEFVVRSVCSSTDSSTYSATRGTFSTSCGVIPHSALPYTYGFEDAAGSGSSYNINRCWHGGTNSSTHYPYPYSSYTHSGSYSCYMYAYSSSNYYTYAVLPEFADNISNLTLSLWARKTSTGSSYTGYLIVGVISDRNNINTFTPYDTLNFTTTSFSRDSVNFENYNGPSGRICLYTKPFSASYNSLYIDDITVYICCATPSVSHSATHDHITLTWSGRGTLYELAIKAVSDTAWRQSVTTTAHTYTFNNLQASTQYMYRVRQICDTSTQSGWAEGQITTRPTPCLTPSHPTIYSLTNVAAGFQWTIGGYESSWVIHTFNATTNRYDTVYNNPATITGLRPHTTYKMVIAGLCSASRTSGWSDTLTFTTLQCDEPTSPTVSITRITATFSWTSNPDANLWEVEYGPHGFTHGQGSIATVSQNPLIIGGLNPNTNYDFYVRTVCGVDFYSDWTPVTSASTGTPSSADCDAVTNMQVNLSANNAVVTWTRGNNNNGNWIVEYGPRGFQHGRGLLLNPTNTRTTLHNLSYNSTYEVYVRADCGSENISPWLGPRQFTPTCNNITGLLAQVAGTTVFLTWNSVPGATYEIEYGPRGFSRGSGTTITGTYNGATLTGLNPNSPYTAYVRAMCDTSTFSNWTSENFTSGAAGVQVCDPVTDFSATRVGTSAVVSWAPGANNTGKWEIEYGSEGFSHGSGTKITGVTRPIRQIDNLSTVINYQFYVRANCSPTSTSPWSPPALLRDPSEGIESVNLPYLYFIIYPNPTDRSMGATISITNSGETQQLDITVIDITGRTVWQRQTECHDNCDEQIPISGLRSGTYFVRLSTPYAATVRKLIIR
ncbi:MAG: choice-of-anchor J domain-containing protein [Bacteroidales bacterium]|nr:choice-of-anchor J domain-containing protein [Bacteroidales bacterium]